MVIMKRNPSQNSPLHALISSLDSILKAILTHQRDPLLRLPHRLVHVDDPVRVVLVILRTLDVHKFLCLEVHHMFWNHFRVDFDVFRCRFFAVDILL